VQWTGKRIKPMEGDDTEDERSGEHLSVYRRIKALRWTVLLLSANEFPN
jgi:hypothetical protein